MKKLLLFVFYISVKVSLCQSWQPVGAGFIPNGVNAFYIYNNVLYVGGGIATSGAVTLNGVGKWNGVFWDSLAAGGSFGNPHCFADYNGQLIAGGDFNKMNGYPNTRSIASWDGTAWHALGLGIGGNVKAMAVYNGSLYVGGDIIAVNGAWWYRDLARWDGTNWYTIPTSGGLSMIESMTIYNGELYVGGYFSSIDSVPVQNIAKFDGTTWSAVGGGLSSDVFCLYVDSISNRLYAGGNFTYTNNNTVSCPSSIAYWDGNVWTPFGMNGPHIYPNTLTVYHGQLYAGFGLFNLPINQNGDTLRQIVRWNGNDWENVGSGLDGSALAMAVYDNKLAVGGGFTTAGGQLVNHVAFWSDSTTDISYHYCPTKII